MELGLEGKVAIVTGGTKGIGRATALALAQEGVNVAICARGTEGLDDATREISLKTGRKALAVKADMTVPEDIRHLVGATVTAFGGVDILVNNAVNSEAALFLDLTDEIWLNHITVKLMGYVRCTREVIPHMQRRGGGRIMNMGSTAARSPADIGTPNGVINAGISNLTTNLANQFGKDGILVNCIHPGNTRTPRTTQMQEIEARVRNTTPEEIMRSRVGNIPIGRLMEPEEFGQLVLFLASRRADAITGQTIAIDGGMVPAVFY